MSDCVTFKPEYLLKAAEIIEAVPRKQFKMDTWSNSNQASCQTVACLGGWMGLDQYFRQRGLKTRMGCVSYKELVNRNAINEFTKLSWDEVDLLFYLPGFLYGVIPTPKQAAKGIRKFVKLRLELGRPLNRREIQKLSQLPR